MSLSFWYSESLKTLYKDYVENHELPDMGVYWSDAIPDTAIRESLLRTPPVLHAVEGLKHPHPRPIKTENAPTTDPEAEEACQDVLMKEEPAAEVVNDGLSDDEDEEDEDVDEVAGNGGKAKAKDVLSDHRVWGRRHSVHGAAGCGGAAAAGAEHDDLRTVFAPSRGVGATDKCGQRVSRISLIFHNASFEQPNVRVLAESATCLRLVLLADVSRKLNVWEI
ncbi:MAG: hypothetical protein MUD14_11495 [Hydrococcus sp. Prado102]|nr:hypothetical protein [Hydrococcus sp. Prado102]